MSVTGFVVESVDIATFFRDCRPTEALLFFASLQLLSLLSIVACGRIALTNVRATLGEIRASVARVESVTLPQRAEFLTQYDKVLVSLAERLPKRISAAVSDRVIDIERDVLTRLAELDPHLRDPAVRAKVDQLVLRMEELESVIVNETERASIEAVRSARALFFNDPKFAGLRLKEPAKIA
jgi:hypothetical protein